MTHLRIQLVLVLICGFIPSFGQEQVSTWPFAEKIGMRGVQMQFGFIKPFEKDKIDNSYFVRLAPSDKQVKHLMNLGDKSVGELDDYGFNSIRLTAIFLPFRKSSNSWLKKSEWQTGLELENHFSLVRTPDPNSKYSIYYSFENNSLFWYNSWFLEHKFFFNNVKVYGGPGAAVSLIPQYQFTAGYTLGPDELIDRGHFGFNLNMTAGMKVSLGCRINLYAEYQYYYQAWYLTNGQIGQNMRGLGLGIRYKFNKPEPREPQEKDKPVFW